MSPCLLAQMHFFRCEITSDDPCLPSLVSTRMGGKVNVANGVTNGKWLSGRVDGEWGGAEVTGDLRSSIALRKGRQSAHEVMPILL